MDTVTQHPCVVRPALTAPRMALVHGFLGSPRTWDELRAHLVGPVETISLRGHAGIVEPEIESFEAELSRLIDARAQRPWPKTLVGYSLGARVALGLAARTPDPFERLVLVSGRDGLLDAEEARARRELDDALAATLRREGLAAFVDRWQGLPLFESQRALPDEIRAAHRARRLAHDPEGVARALSELSLGRMPRFGATAVARTARVDLVVGARDAKFRRLAQDFVQEHAAVREIRLHVVPDAGHDVVLERPAALAAILEERP